MKNLFKTLIPMFVLLISLFLVRCKETSEVAPSGNATGVEDAKKAATVTTPKIECAGSTQVSISIKVTAPSGGTGMPAGFSLQWMTAAAYALGPDGSPGTADDNTWYSSDDPRLCKGSFSGNANLSRYNLKEGESVTVKVGDFLLDQGASTNCGDELDCETQYVFRAFAHATSSLNRSAFTNNLTCETKPCGSTPGEGCTLTQGFWKTHGPVNCNPSSKENVWPVSELALGSKTYNATELCDILNTPAGGNGLIALAHQLIAAKFNIVNGANGTDIAASITAADNLIGSLVIPPVGSGYLAPSATSALTDALANFNEGGSGPGHCGK